MNFENLIKKSKETFDESIDADVEHTAMHELYDAVENLDKEASLNIIKSGFDVDSRDESGDTLLHCMISAECSLSVVQLLVDIGFEINAKNKRNWTALFLVRKYLVPNNANKAIHQYLISKGAISKPDRLGDKWL